MGLGEITQELVTVNQPPPSPKLVLCELWLILFVFSVRNSTDLCDFPKEFIKNYPAVTGLIFSHPGWNKIDKIKHTQIFRIKV